MFPIPGEIFWPTAAFATLILVILGGVILLRYLPHPKTRGHADPDVLEDLEARVGELEQMQRRVGELEERLDFAERLLAKPQDGERVKRP